MKSQLALHTLTRGSTGLPLVLLHAFPLDHRMWAHVCDLLPGTITVLAPDLPGLGQSPPGDDLARALGRDATPSLDLSAAAVAAALAAAGYDRAVFAGLSMGGYVTLALMDHYEGLVAGAGIIDSKASSDDEVARAHRAQVATELSKAVDTELLSGMKYSLLAPANRTRRPDLVDRLGQWIMDQAAPGCAWSQRAMAARADRLAVLARFTGPTLLARGEDDQLATAADLGAMAAVARDSEVLTVARSGHMSALENPQPVAGALARLWARALG